MAVTDHKITSTEIANSHVQKQPNRLTGTAPQNKAVFDALPELMADKYNDALDEIGTELVQRDSNLNNLREDLLDEIHNYIPIEQELQPKTAYNKDFEDSDNAIQMDGVASAGFSGNVARADHVHPTDTTRASEQSVSDLGIRVSSAEETVAEAVASVDEIKSKVAITGASASNVGGAIKFTKDVLGGDSDAYPQTIDVPVHGLGNSAYKDVATSYNATSENPMSGIAVAAAIEGVKIKTVSASRTMVAQSAGAKGNFHLDWNISNAPFAVYCTTSSVGYANGAIFSVINVGNTGVYVNYYFPNATTNSFVVQVKAAYVEY